MDRPVRVLSFGAGTQSSAVLGLIEEGKLPPVDFAVFADTQCEPDEVYRWLDKIMAWAKTRIIVATRGNLLQDVLDSVADETKRSVLPPFFTNNQGEEGILNRKCTADYKIRVIQQAIKKELGYAPRQRVKGHHVVSLIAMSLDETTRMRDSREKWITNSYPLIFDIPMHRQQSIDYVKTLGLGEPPRSSCMMCPFHSDAEWKHLRDREPHNFQKAIEFDRAIRRIPRMTSETFVHRSRLPLEQVDFDAESPQLDMFENECEGMCGA